MFYAFASRIECMTIVSFGASSFNGMYYLLPFIWYQKETSFPLRSHLEAI